MDSVPAPITATTDTITASEGHSAHVQIHESKKRCYLPTRYVLVILLFLGNFNFYGMRVNLNVALVAMVNESDTGHDQRYSYCRGPLNETHRTDTAGEFDWSPLVEGAILTSFYYGYLVTQIPGSCLSMYFSAKWTLGLSMLFSAVLNFITPLAAYHGYVALIGTRVALGLVQGVYFPASDRLLGVWIPPNERSTSFSVVSAGLDIGNMVYLFVSGILASSDIFQGWPSVFYFSGIAGVCWCILWFPLAYDSPSVHPWISRHEKNYLMESLDWDSETKQQRVSQVPWIPLLVSVPVWSYVICQVCVEFGIYLFMAEAPEYFSSIQGFDLSESGLLSGLPWVLELFTGLFSSVVADFIINKNLFRVVTVRKGMTFIGSFVQCSLLMGAAYSGCDTTIASVCFIIAVSFSGFYTPGYAFNKFDIAPNSAAVLTGISNGLGTIGGIAGPYLVSYITGRKPTVKEWQYIFWMITAIYLFGVLVFTIFGSGEHQSWDKALAASTNRSSHGDGGQSPLLDEEESED